MILCDANVLIALTDDRDSRQRRAQSDLRDLARQTFLVTEPVLAEVLFLLPNRMHRIRLRDLLTDLTIEFAPPLNPSNHVEEIFDWLGKYAEHSPDWADAHLAVLSQHYPKYRVWTYDREFRSTWRRPDGSRIPMAIK